MHSHSFIILIFFSRNFLQPTKSIEYGGDLAKIPCEVSKGILWMDTEMEHGTWERKTQQERHILPQTSKESPDAIQVEPRR